MISSYQGVAVCCPVTVPYEKTSARGAAWYIGRCLAGLVKAAGVPKDQIDGLAVSSFTAAPDSVVGLTQHFGLEPRWIEQVPFGGAGGVIALRRAARAVQAGEAGIIACIGGDTNQPGGFKALINAFSRFSTDAVVPYGVAGPNAVFAMITRAYMDATGTKREDFGRLCVAQRRNAMAFPHALLRKPLTLEQYMAARPVAEPLHLFDCVMPCAGAEGFLVMSVDRAKALGLPHAVILGAVERHNAYSADPVQRRSGWTQEAADLYAQASLGPDGVDVLETYDDYPVIVFLQLEAFGFPTDTAVPHNTSGGQLSAGQAGSGGGYMGLTEGLRQITGQALGMQVEGARRALVSGYGMVNYDRGVCAAATILERGQ